MRVLYPGFAGGDRTDLKLPETQSEMLRALNDTGTPIALALTAGSALAVNWAKENPDAIIYLRYPGEEGGTALANILFGNTNLSGREVVQLYIKDDDASAPVPIQSLKKIASVFLKSGKSKKISFELTPKNLSIIKDELTYPVDNSNSIV